MKLRARAYAKINWLLEVGALQPNGYHDLNTLFQTIDLYDQLLIEPAEQLSLEISTVNNSPPAMLKADASNLVLRAAHLLQKHLAIRSGAQIHLYKQIPLAAGLGGGSADAAITLLALNKLWQTQLSHKELSTLAAELGSDVPFFLSGGTAWGRGRGTEIEPVADVVAPYLLLVNPGIEVPTPRAYQEFDRLTKTQPLNILAACSFSKYLDIFTQARNSLTMAVTTLYPVIKEVEKELTALGAEPVLISGSGATVWARFTSGTQRQAAVAALSQREWLVIETQTVTRDSYLSSIISVIP